MADTCKECGQPLPEKIECPICKGTGKVTIYGRCKECGHQRSWVAECTKCKGTGKVDTPKPFFIPPWPNYPIVALYMVSMPYDRRDFNNWTITTSTGDEIKWVRSATANESIHGKGENMSSFGDHTDGQG